VIHNFIFGMTWNSSEIIVIVSVSGGMFSILGLVIRAILKSSCKEFSCCYGLIHCTRDSSSVGPSIDVENGSSSGSDLSPTQTPLSQCVDKNVRKNVQPPLQIKHKKQGSFSNLMWVL
jgi:hypothetical protein